LSSACSTPPRAAAGSRGRRPFRAGPLCRLSLSCPRLVPLVCRRLPLFFLALRSLSRCPACPGPLAALRRPAGLGCRRFAV